MNRTIMLACLLTLLFGTGAYFLNVDRSPDHSATELVLAEVGLADARLPQAVEVSAPVEVERTEVLLPQEITGKDPGEGAGLISGRVQIEELDGSVSLEATGTLVLSVKQQRRTYELSVAIEAGAWELPKAQLVDLLKGRRLQLEGEVGFSDVMIPGRGTRLAWQGDKPKSLLSDRGVLLRLKAAATGRLFVEDAVTGAALSNVTVLNSSGVFDDQRDDSGRSGFPMVIDGGASPIDLALSSRMATSLEVKKP